MYFYQLIGIPPIFRLSLDRLRQNSLASILLTSDCVFSKLYNKNTQKSHKNFPIYTPNHTHFLIKIHPPKTPKNSSFT